MDDQVRTNREIKINMGNGVNRVLSNRNASAMSTALSGKEGSLWVKRCKGVQESITDSTGVASVRSSASVEHLRCQSA